MVEPQLVSRRRRTWAILVSLAAIAIFLYPPRTGRYGREFLFAPVQHGRIDYERVLFEMAGGVFLALLAAFVPVPSLAWLSPKIRTALLVSISALTLLTCAAWAFSKAAWSLPAGDVGRLSGNAGLSEGSLTVQIYNGSNSWTLKEVVVKVTQHFEVKVIPPPPPGFESSWKPIQFPERAYPGWKVLPDTEEKVESRVYRIDGLDVPPLQSRPVWTKIVQPAEAVKLFGWEIVSAKGVKRLW